MNDQNNDRRNFIKKAAYIAPAVITLAAMPSIAQSGSGASSNGNGNGGGNLGNPLGSVHGNRPSGAGRRHG